MEYAHVSSRVCVYMCVCVRAHALPSVLSCFRSAPMPFLIGVHSSVMAVRLCL